MYGSTTANTMTDTKYCIYTAGTGIVCNSEGGSGGGGGSFSTSSDAGDIIYPQDSTFDLVIGTSTGASATLTAPFFFDVSAKDFYIGNGGGIDSVVDFYASGSHVWTMGLDYSDEMNFILSTTTDFSGGNVLTISSTTGDFTLIGSIAAAGSITASNISVASTTNWDLAYEKASNTKSVSINFVNATDTVNNVDAFWSPGAAITVHEISCISDGVMAIDFGICTDQSLSTSSQLTEISCDTDGASSTAFEDAGIAAKELVKGEIGGITSGTSTYVTIYYTLDD